MSNDPHELVWATHAGVEQAARVPRSFLSVNTGWKEVTERSVKVQAASAQAQPAGDVSPAQTPTESPKRAAKKE